jgi:hypothetical protein
MLIEVIVRFPGWLRPRSGVGQVRHLEAVPEPLLQGGEADQHGIGGQQAMRSGAAAGALPSQFGGVDEDQAARRAGLLRVERHIICREAGDVLERSGVSVTVEGASRTAGAVVMNAW